MPLANSQTTLGQLIETELAAALGPTYKADPTTIKVWTAVAKAIVTHITAQAIVNVPAGVPVATAGSATAQTGATTAPGVGTLQ